MSDTPIPVPGPPVDPAWADWVTVWQSEMAAMAVDREVHEALQRAADLWATAALAAGHDPSGRTGAAPAAGSAPALAASDRQPAPDAGRPDAAPAAGPT